MKNLPILTGLAVALATSTVLAGAAIAEQRQRQPAPESSGLQPCPDVEAGQNCIGRDGVVRRRPAPGPRGFVRPEVDDEVVVGFESGDTASPAPHGEVWLENLPPGAAGGTGNRPVASAMESEFSDDDDDPPPPKPVEPADTQPAPSGNDGDGDDEDCEWHNPAGGPDQEFCDE